MSTVESYGIDGFQGFLQLANQQQIDVVSATFQTDVTDLTSQMNLLQEAGVKIILTMVSLDNCTFMYREILYETEYYALC